MMAATLLLAHGAGADQRSSFMVSFSRELASRGLNVVTFNFPYTEQRRRVPDKQPVLEACYRSVIDSVGARLGAQTMFIGGKSMGGRIATHVASSDGALAVAGLVLLGYPLHPPGRPEVRRDAHLKDVKRPMLIVQGSRDTFGTPSELAPVLAGLPVEATLHVVEGGDHSFKLSKSNTAVQAEAIQRVQSAIVEWIGRITKGGR
jgi:predicted alpha/beta-hydrolase family hydrolase